MTGHDSARLARTSLLELTEDCTPPNPTRAVVQDPRRSPSGAAAAPQHTDPHGRLPAEATWPPAHAAHLPRPQLPRPGAVPASVAAGHVTRALVPVTCSSRWASELLPSPGPTHLGRARAARMRSAQLSSAHGRSRPGENEGQKLGSVRWVWAGRGRAYIRRAAQSAASLRCGRLIAFSRTGAGRLRAGRRLRVREGSEAGAGGGAGWAGSRAACGRGEPRAGVGQREPRSRSGPELRSSAGARGAGGGLVAPCCPPAASTRHGVPAGLLSMPRFIHFSAQLRRAWRNVAASGVGASCRYRRVPRTCSAAAPPPAAAAGRGGTGTEVLRWAERRHAFLCETEGKAGDFVLPRRKRRLFGCSWAVGCRCLCSSCDVSNSGNRSYLVVTKIAVLKLKHFAQEINLAAA